MGTRGPRHPWACRHNAGNADHAVILCRLVPSEPEVEPDAPPDSINKLEAAPPGGVGRRATCGAPCGDCGDCGAGWRAAAAARGGTEGAEVGRPIIPHGSICIGRHISPCACCTPAPNPTVLAAAADLAAVGLVAAACTVALERTAAACTAEAGAPAAPAGLAAPDGGLVVVGGVLPTTGSPPTARAPPGPGARAMTAAASWVEAGRALPGAAEGPAVETAAVWVAGTTGREATVGAGRGPAEVGCAPRGFTEEAAHAVVATGGATCDCNGASPV